ncbi:hypothetical protein AB0K09_31260 [Streptomyces sp. NPDC049577]|uniref:hypothetical protein n=1 Tax=Streptomyces sp. NPDC049577 TaxID=3155153 RepID=UPI003433D920
MPVPRRIAATALLSATVLALPAAGTATADTNKSEQTSALSGPLAPVLSPAGARFDSGQANGQVMDKANASNWSLIDYVGTRRKDGDYDTPLLALIPASARRM